MTARRLAAVGLCLALFSACGGKQTSDPGTGGAAGAGGTGALGGSSSGGTGGSSSGGTGGSTSCVPGGACAKEGDGCMPPGCCECSYSCVAGHWQIAACPGCLAPSCPAAPPSNGAACDECEHPVGTACSYGQCPGGLVQATCDGSKWTAGPVPCPAPVPCGSGPMPCAAGQLCVHPGGLGDSEYCTDNPCKAGEPVSCACAGSLCTYGYCSNATPSAVYCECPNC